MVDEISKQKVIDWLHQNGLSCFDSDQVDNYSSWDLSTLTYTDKKVGIEIKNREKYSSDGFMAGINSCEENKVLKNRELIQNGTFDAVILISIYNDGIWRISNIMQNYERDVHNSPKTTYWNNERITKVYANFRKYKEFRRK